MNMRRWVYILVWVFLLSACATPRLEQKASQDTIPSPVAGGIPCLLFDW
jgi:hypothetical protein